MLLLASWTMFSASSLATSSWAGDTKSWTSVTVSSLTESRTYYVRVAARNSIGTSAFCDSEGLTCDGARLSAVAPEEGA